ncbi:hypothetical protein CPT_Moabite_160 [Serratia phage Moabite]|uniref:Uncharacterized protein n=3 Tax=Moabitevirus TaxID=2843422 RepID=A0A7T3TLT6_9CAUD|nr:hypothetical protein HWB23_gp076 [Serratia phage vB_SmaM_ 2050HW]YP_009849254.1 hypothetical protein HWC48_gp256 [Serratia phage Moabite]QPX76664.1 hypothetical protein [Serratia phage vB_SmaM_Yaphecito]UCR74690.1 hypothetical protein [Serratia phage BUCT660]UGO54045.1 hypothetical protein HAYMO_63 [Serratia phage vB_SmaM_Haymo]URG14257.1 hypothetical protein [Pectobacterium phage vB_ParM-25]ATA65411.1 hypothetical protein 2050HW_00076 [Serratia phage vB_SmaM_ 2050HW]
MKKHSLSLIKAEQAALVELVKVVPMTAPSNEALALHRPLMPLINKFSDFLKKVSSSFSMDIEPEATDVLATRDPNIAKLQQRLANVPYIDIIDQRVPVTPGLDVTWLEYLDAYRHPVEFSINMYDNYLKPFEKFLATAITSPEQMSAVGKIITIKQADVQGMLKAIAEPVSGNQRTVIRKYGDCAQRNADTIEAMNLTKAMGEGLSSSNMDLVNASVDNIGKMLDTLAVQIKDSNLPYRFNPKSIKELSEVTYDVAEMVELYAAVYTRFASHKQAMDDTAKKLLSVLPR